jgi:hypothetical protein
VERQDIRRAPDFNIKTSLQDRYLPALVYYLYNDHFDFNICLYPVIYFTIFYCIANSSTFLKSTWICFNVIIITVIPTSFVSTFSYCCKHFGIPQKCTLLLDVPQTWFNNWPYDGSMRRNMSLNL